MSRSLFPVLMFALLVLLVISIHTATASGAVPPAATRAGSYDMIVLSATPAGIMAAVALARLRPSSKVLVLERNKHVGGLPANGLGATDIATRGATGGLFLEFVDRVQMYYVKTYGNDSKQVRDSRHGYRFEPHVAETVLKGFLDELGGRVRVLTGRQFDAQPRHLRIQSNRVQTIHVEERDTGKAESYEGKYFVDASYEGDLIGAAGVPFFLGREENSTYDEIGAGVVYKFWHGEETSDSTHQGDNAIQAYNYRLSLTNNPSNFVPFPKPDQYDRSEYTSLIADINSNCHTGKQAAPFPCPDLNPNELYPILGVPRGIHRLASIVGVPNRKWDGNNQHLAYISTDLPEENWAYPTSSWAWRDRFADRLRDYTLGFFYFAQNDNEVPEYFRNATQRWGLAKDEYKDNNNFPRQVYVREGRRMHGTYIFTSSSASAPPNSESITSSHYALDSHAVRKREEGKKTLDGFVSYSGPVPRPYTVPFGVMVPNEGPENILGPVPVSGSHIGFSTLRMEPCWMALGQAAGTAVGLLLEGEQGGAVKGVDIKKLQRKLLEAKAVLVWIKGWEQMRWDDFVDQQWRILHGESFRN
jgi:hypothetical protein